MSTFADRVTGVSTNQAIKVACRLATTANITLSGAQTIDGVSAVAGDRVLVKDQTAGAENGIYKSGAGTIATDNAKERRCEPSRWLRCRASTSACAESS